MTTWQDIGTALREKSRQPKERLTADDVRERVVRRMDEIDRLTPAQRAVVHDFGWAIVKLFRECGVIDPKKQRMLINRILYDLNTAYHEMASTGRKRPSPPSKEGE